MNFLNNPVVQSYIAHSALLALKLIACSLLTARLRLTKGVFANPEDTKISGKKSVVKYDDQDVERIRRAHMNDLENIPAFWILGALYVTTSPSAAWAALLFRTFTAGRFLHTLVYAVTPLPQPARAIAFFIPYVINWYLGIQVVLYYASSL